MKYGTGTIDFDYPDLLIPYKEELRLHNEKQERIKNKLEYLRINRVVPEKEYMLCDYSKVKESELTEENKMELIEFGFDNHK